MTQPSTNDLRRRIVGELLAEGSLHAPAWQSAFAEVPRHIFLSRFYRQTPDLSGWQAIDHEHPEWLDLVYSNTTWVTQLDHDDERWSQAIRDGAVSGTPTSSSTAPGLMGLMLEALDVEPGHRVLEVGTGTGYNAALLAHRLGSANVTSVEVDPNVADRAEQSLTTAGYSPRLVIGDGTRGDPAGAPFDRVIATVSVPRVPHAWITQTRPGGVVLTSLHRDLGGGVLVRLSIGTDDTAVGHVLHQFGSFMPIRTQPHVEANELLQAALHGPRGQRRPTTLDGDAIHEPDFGMLAALLLPDASSIGFTSEAGDEFWLLTPGGSWSCLDARRNEVEQYGPRRLWDELEVLRQRWQSWGEPSRDRFGLTVGADGAHTVWLDTPSRTIAQLWRPDASTTASSLSDRDADGERGEPPEGADEQDDAKSDQESL